MVLLVFFFMGVTRYKTTTTTKSESHFMWQNSFLFIAGVVSSSSGVGTGMGESRGCAGYGRWMAVVVTVTVTVGGANHSAGYVTVRVGLDGELAGWTGLARAPLKWVALWCVQWLDWYPPLISLVASIPKDKHLFSECQASFNNGLFSLKVSDFSRSYIIYGYYLRT